MNVAKNDWVYKKKIGFRIEYTFGTNYANSI